MSFFVLKSILAAVFFVCALAAALSMLTMMGKAEKKTGPKTLRTAHKISGRLFLILLLVLLFLGMRYWVKIGDQASLRAVFHAVLGLGLTIIFLLKLSVVKVFKQFMRFAPGLGMLVFGFAFVVFAISAGFYTIKSLSGNSLPPEEIHADSSETTGSVDRGAVFFNARCLSCHSADSDEKKLGPGLKGLLKKENLPHSGRPATVENVKQQLLKPVLTMPAFPKLTDRQMADLIAYLETL